MKKLLLILLLLTNSVFAGDGMVVALRGDVSIDELKALQGSEIVVGNTITAGNKSFAIIQFTDGSKLTVRPNSKVYINQYAYNTEADSAQFDLVEGGLRVVTGALAKTSPENYKVKTPVALMGVRGTEFSIYLMGD